MEVWNSEELKVGDSDDSDGEKEVEVWNSEELKVGDSDDSDGDGRFETEYIHIDDIEGNKLSKDMPPSPDDKCA